ncbi:MAG TPA: PAAR domain-containing protein [Reyranella sp.]|nr:PAAR domain-containing protein [Reyranella sp.]
MPAAARVGDLAGAQVDTHGCPGCPHPPVGPAIAGSANVNINNLPAFRQGDAGMHAVCCGPNTWTAQKGSSTVNINGKPAMRQNDMTKHCGGVGQMTAGSPTVNIGG